MCVCMLCPHVFPVHALLCLFWSVCWCKCVTTYAESSLGSRFNPESFVHPRRETAKHFSNFCGGF